MCHPMVLPRHAPGHGARRDFLCDVFLDVREVQDLADPLQDTAGGRGDGEPDRLQDPEHCSAVDLVDRHSADNREHVVLEAWKPRFMLAVLPTAFHCPVALARDLRENGGARSEEHTSELQSLLRTSYSV